MMMQWRMKEKNEISELVGREDTVLFTYFRFVQPPISTILLMSLTVLSNLLDLALRGEIATGKSPGKTCLQAEVVT
jgi:hypothetical protein